jgi:hypothetical protein
VFIRSLDQTGNTWGGVSVIGGGYDDLGGDEHDVRLVNWNGVPISFFHQDLESGGRTLYSYSLDSSGSDWSVPTRLDGPDFGLDFVSQPAVYDGQLILPTGTRRLTTLPYINVTENLTISSEPVDGVWHDANLIMPFDMVEFSLGWIADRLAAAMTKVDNAYFTENQFGEVVFIRALNDDATAWPAAPVVVADTGYSKGSTLLMDAGGHPAIAYRDLLFNRVMFVRALDPVGNNWGIPQTLDWWMEGRLRHAMHEGRPVLLYQDQITGGFKFIAANDERGDSWGLPMLVWDGDPANRIVFPDSIVDIGGNPSFCSVHAGAVHAAGPHVDYVSYY